MALLSLLILLVLFISPLVNASNNDALIAEASHGFDNFVEINDLLEESRGEEYIVEKSRCTTKDQEKEAWKEVNANVEKLKAAGKLRIGNVGTRPSFIWPLKNLLPGKYGYVYGISNYVDHDSRYKYIKDYKCGKRSYDIQGYNHQGIDISLWPFPWLMKQEEAAGIIAAAAGVIVGRYDGNADNNCGFGNGNWNAVYIKHDDGSIAWYGHMKKGSVTAKGVGSTVVQGELLGKVGSSGSSTGPHLHFEIYDSNNKLNDPFVGTCNKKNTFSWWVSQPPYWNPRINFIGVFSGLVAYPTCPQIETAPLVSSIQRGKKAYFYSFFTAQTLNSVATCQILKADNTVWQSFIIKAPKTYPYSYWYYSYTIPTNAGTGTWTYKCNYNGVTLIKGFTVF